MSNSKSFALVCVGAFYFCARLPTVSEPEMRSIASKFSFEVCPLPAVGPSNGRIVRAVHPSLSNIASWISAVGASVALADLDGDALANDVCYVDVRNDVVVVAPVPGTQSRYPPFELHPGAEFFHAETMAPMGCVPGDFNEDGCLDVMVYYWGRTPVLFLRSSCDFGTMGATSFVPKELQEGGERWYTSSVLQADVDGDGHLDLIVGNYFPDGARVLDQTYPGEQVMQASMSRANNGGRSRLLLWEKGVGGKQPSVEYRDFSGSLEQAIGGPFTSWTLALGAGDLDHDQLPEVYFANDFGPDRLLHNRSRPGRPLFAVMEGTRGVLDPRSKVLGNDSFKGMGCEFVDLNGDQIQDILVSNIASERALEESHFAFISSGQVEPMKYGIAPYVDCSEALGLSRSGWGWDIKVGDFDNDSMPEVVQANGFIAGKTNRWPELHEVAMGNDQLLANPQNWHNFLPGDSLSGEDHLSFYATAKDGRFYDVSQLVGIGKPQVSRAIAIGDIEGDGDLDFIVANQWEESRLYRNTAPKPGAYIGLRLLLPVDRGPLNGSLVLDSIVRPSMKCRPAIGAAVTVLMSDGRMQSLQVDGGNGHSGVRSTDLHFGLGHQSMSSRVPIEIAWRGIGGRVLRRKLDLAPGWHTIVLGE